MTTRSGWRARCGRSCWAGSSESLDPGRLHDPVDLPGRAVIDRESLLPTARRLGDVGPQEADEDRPTFERVGADEGADAVLEPADDGRIEAARSATVEPPDRPTLRPGFEGPERDRP